MKKTRIFGFGEWRGRTNWPYPHINVEIISINILRIIYAHDINTAIDVSWSDVIFKIKQKIGILHSRCFTLHTVHTFPLNTQN